MKYTETTRPHIKTSRAIIFLALTATLGLILIYLSSSSNLSDDNTDAKKGGIAELVDKEDYFSSIPLTAKSVFVYDMARDEVLYSVNEELQLPLASLAKTMTALVVDEFGDNDKDVLITGDAISQEGDSGFFVGEYMSPEDLVDITLVSSSNDGARALASAGASLIGGSGYTTEEYFISNMNKKADSLGMAQTFYLNESGLDVNSGIAGAYGSAKDMALLFSYIMRTHPRLLEATAYETVEVQSSHFIHSAKNTNDIISDVPSVIASKTGFTELAGGNLVMAFDAGPMRPIVVSVLGSTRQGRFDDMNALIWASIKSIQR